MRNLLYLILILIVTIYGCDKQEKAELSIIPQPKIIIEGKRAFFLKNSFEISVSSESLVRDAEYLAGQISHRFSMQAGKISVGDPGGKIRLELDPGIPHTEGYHLKSDRSGVLIRGQTSDGIFYGIQTLLQLLPLEGPPSIPAVEISDEPRFVWRGMHLDVGRHFYEVDFIKKMLNAMAMHKLNTFHWHLTEDQGWRIEINQYPKLTEVAAWRDETLVGHESRKPFMYDGKKHGGYYTHEQIIEVVDYARELHITVIPEIELPGHSEAAIAAYPELSCFSRSEGVAKRWAVFENVYCAGKETTFEFLENVFSEVIELFPSEYIHIGGDESPKAHWKKCAHCQWRIKEEGLKDEHELQSYFIQRIERYLNNNGKKLIGWDEILEGGLAENAAVMSWRGEKGGIAAVNMGHYVVMTPGNWCYFDHYQSDFIGEPLAIGGLTRLKEVYNYDPMPVNIDSAKRHLILGVQANVWTEYMSTPEQTEYMIFPRLCAMSEVQWTSPAEKNYDDFLERMKPHYARLSARGINYRAPMPEKIDQVNIVGSFKKTIGIAMEQPGLKMIYSLDGADPAENGLLYDSPVVLPAEEQTTLKVRILMPDGRMSAVVEGTYIQREIAQVRKDNLEMGLSFKLYSSKDPDQPSSEGVLDDIALPAEMNTGDRIIIEGYVMIESEGTLRLGFWSAASPAKLKIGDFILIENEVASTIGEIIAMSI